MNWTPQQLQQLADAYSAKNPTWTPPAEQNAALPNPIQPATFNPNSDPGFVLGNAAILQANQNAQGNYDYGVLSGSQQFGYDANGNLITSGAGYNPFNQAAQLQRSYDNAKRGTTNSYAASGQLYSGALQNAQGENTYQYNKSSDALQRGASDYYHGLQSNLDSTKLAGQTSYAQLVMNALQNYLSSQGG